MHLEKPLFEESPRQIFERSVESFTNTELKSRLKNCAPQVEADSEQFENDISVPRFTIDSDQSRLSAGKEEFYKVYNDKFAKANAPCRIYYDRLMLLAKYGICPICGQATANTLDHYASKSIYPTLSVTPVNLVPECITCNKEKKDIIINSVCEMPFHPYYDDWNDAEWLYAEIFRDTAVAFSVVGPTFWNAAQVQRVKRTFDIYNLAKSFSQFAAQHISEHIHSWRILKNNESNDGGQLLIAHMEAQLESFQCYDLNSWKSALYRALLRNPDIVNGWLENGPQ